MFLPFVCVLQLPLLFIYFLYWEVFALKCVLFAVCLDVKHILTLCVFNCCISPHFCVFTFECVLVFLAFFFHSEVISFNVCDFSFVCVLSLGATIELPRSH